MFISRFDKYNQVYSVLQAHCPLALLFSVSFLHPNFRNFTLWYVCVFPSQANLLLFLRVLWILILAY